MISPQNIFVKLYFCIQFLEIWNDILVHGLHEWCGVKDQEFHCDKTEKFYKPEECTEFSNTRRCIMSNWLSWRYIFALRPNISFIYSSKINIVTHAFLSVLYITHNLILITLFLLNTVGLEVHLCTYWYISKSFTLQLLLA